MRKILVLGFVVGCCGMLWSATLNVPANAPISVLTLTQVAQSTPTYTGQFIVCSNCGSINGALGTVCISTESANAQNAYIIAGSSLTATTTCK